MIEQAKELKNYTHPPKRLKIILHHSKNKILIHSMKKKCKNYVSGKRTQKKMERRKEKGERENEQVNL